MSKTEKVHERIWARHGLRVTAARQGHAILVSDTRRAVYQLPTTQVAFRVAWYQEILDQLDAGAQPTPEHGAEYRTYAR